MKSTSNLKHFEEENELHSLSFSETIDSKRGGYLIVEKVLFQNNLW